MLCVERLERPLEAVGMCRDENVVGMIGHEEVGDYGDFGFD